MSAVLVTAGAVIVAVTAFTLAVTAFIMARRPGYSQPLRVDARDLQVGDIYVDSVYYEAPSEPPPSAWGNRITRIQGDGKRGHVVFDLDGLDYSVDESLVCVTHADGTEQWVMPVWARVQFR